MPDAADVLAAIRRLEFQGPRKSDDLGPSEETGVSGRSVSFGGPLFSAPLRDLGLLLDDSLIDDLLLVEGPRVSIPVEMALGALAGPDAQDGGDASRESLLDAAVDTLGARWRLSSWSGREPSRIGDVVSSPAALAPPSFLNELPFGAHKRRSAGRRFPWDLLDGGRARSPRAAGRETIASTVKIDAREAREAFEARDVAGPHGRDRGETMAPESLAGASPRGSGAAAGAPEEAHLAADADRWETGARSETLDRDAAAAAIARAKRSPTPFTVVFASLVFPGWGQSLNEQRGKAAIFRIASLTTLVLAATLAWRGPLGSLAGALPPEDLAAAFHGLGRAFSAGVGLWLLSAYDAFIVRSARAL